MRITITLFFLTCISVVSAQPSNDNCSGAIPLTLGTPPPCPIPAVATNTFNFSNVGATAVSPYPTFSNCSIGNQTNAPAEEVWFTFTPNSNQLEITLSGALANPNIVIFTGNNCAALTAIDCARGGASPLVLPLQVIPNQQYYMMVSGGFPGDQGNFTLTMVSSRNCAPCRQRANFVASPPPLNGTYNSGQTVNFCFTITEWDVTGSLEWLHSLTLNLGPGWDQSTLTTTPPPSCGGDGAWGWYNSWVGCNTGQIYGPGFAYDSNSGIDCGGDPSDGDPGNNWGDGFNGCELIGNGTPLTVQFCWSVQVADCPANFTGNSLSVQAQVNSDGTTGSWSQTGCNSGRQYNFLASAVCCNDTAPTVVVTPASCAQVSDGAITVEGGTAGTPYDYTVFLSTGQLLFDSLGVVGPLTVPDLSAGEYTLLAVNVQSGCRQSQSIIVGAGPPPQAMASNDGPYCRGDTTALMGAYTFGDTAINVGYQWTGPGGYSSNEQNPANATAGGAYVLVVTVDGCTSPADTTTIVFETASVLVAANPVTVCPSAPSVLTATGADTYVWSTGESGDSITVNPLQTSTYTVTATNSLGCFATADVTVDVHVVPGLSITGPLSGCHGDTVTLSAVGGPFVQYQWSNGQTGNQIAVGLVSPQSDYSVTATSAEGCDVVQTISITAIDNPVAGASASPDTICIGGTSTLTGTGGAMYQWSNNETGASVGVSPLVTTTYQVTVTSVDGCRDTTSVTVNVDQVNAMPSISCADVGSNFVTFEWDAIPDATGYEVSVTGGQTETISATTYTVSGVASSTPVTIEVTAISGTTCPNTAATFTCTTLSCSPIGVAIQSPGDFCFGASNMPLALSATISGSGGTSMWSGPGIIDAALGVFHPDTAGIGMHNIVLQYTEGFCVYADSVTVQVFPSPTASFSVSNDSICITGSLSVTYTGNASAAANYVWDFDGGIAVPGTGQGPHNLSWNTAGTKNISLTVEENGCGSSASNQSVTVQTPLAVPVINCNNTTTSVSFSWAGVPGATGYQATVLSGQTGTLSNTTYTVTGLMPEEQVQLELIVQGNTVCGPTSAAVTCNAAACPVFDISISEVSPICLTANTPAQSLMVSVMGGTTGAGLWSGNGITNPIAGVFDPNIAGAGQHTITYTFTEGPCTGTATVMINVFTTPTASFGVSLSQVCTGQDITVIFNGSAGNTATYDWNFGGGTANPGTGQGPHNVNWGTAGAPGITLTLTENGCISAPFSQTVQVDAPLAAPVITCGTSNTDFVSFNWADVPGASGYEVTVLSGPMGTQSGNTYTVSGLLPGASASIRVTALNTSVCGPSSADQTCMSRSCPTLALAISGTTLICSGEPAQVTFNFAGSSAGPFTLVYNINGGPPVTGVFTNGQSIPIQAASTTTINAVSITDNSLPGCMYPSSSSWTIFVTQPVSAGTPVAPASVCAGENTTINLLDLLLGASPGGTWTETSTLPSSMGAFNAAAGTFDVSGQPAGLFTFTYTVTGPNPCPGSQATVSVELKPTPRADAGPDQMLTCNTGMASLGGLGTSTEPGTTYLWTSSSPGVVISNATSRMIEVTQAGTFLLTVANDVGCTSMDEAIVTADFEAPVAQVELIPISCFQSNDGIIRITGVSGGNPPYQFAFNGGSFGMQQEYTGLSARQYTITVRDQNSCFSEITLDMVEPVELVVNILTNLSGQGNIIQWGDSIRLQAVYSGGSNIDTISWRPDSISQNEPFIWVKPNGTTTYSVSVVDRNGCRAENQITIQVDRTRRVFIPNAFSPNGDGINDEFSVFAHSGQVRQIKSLLVFSRWGEKVYELYNFLPNDPGIGWNGRYRNKDMDAGVFLYVAEVEFFDGEVILYKGDVALLR